MSPDHPRRRNPSLEDPDPGPALKSPVEGQRSAEQAPRARPPGAEPEPEPEPVRVLGLRLPHIDRLDPGAMVATALVATALVVATVVAVLTARRACHCHPGSTWNCDGCCECETDSHRGVRPPATVAEQVLVGEQASTKTTHRSGASLPAQDNEDEDKQEPGSGDAEFKDERKNGREAEKSNPKASVTVPSVSEAEARGLAEAAGLEWNESSRDVLRELGLL